MTISRRSFLGSAAAGAALMTGTVPFSAWGAGNIKLGSIHPTSGFFDIYGVPMDKAVELALEEINNNGGLNGVQVDKITYDTQSDMALYTQYGKKLAQRDRVDVVHGAVLSAAREAIRPTLHKSGTLYFYNTQYEGGVCDRNIFCTGVTPAQQSEVLIPHAIKKWGKKIYILGADYNYGQITAKWAQHYAEAAGGEIVQADFFPLDVADFGTTITKIQEADPDMIVSILVGGAHLAFYRQWAAAGMNKKIPMVSTTFAAGNEQKALTAQEGDGILLAYTFSDQMDTPNNKTFLANWKNKFGNTDDIHELAVATYNGVHLWAEGVRKAGSAEHDAVVEALESGISFEGPTTKISIDPQTHHAVVDIHILEVKDQKLNVVESFSQRQPVDTQTVCNLQENPDSNVQYEIKL